MKRPGTQMARSRKGRQALCILVALLAMVLRVVYVPAHLALEEHVGSVEYLLHHGVASESHVHTDHVAHHGHDDHHGHHDHDAHHDHDHDQEHPPHTVFDHASELVIQRAPAKHGAGAVLARAWCSAASLPPLLEIRSTPSPASHEYESEPPSRREPRGPPAAA